MFKDVVYKSDYLIISYDANDNFLYIKWLPSVLDLDAEDFKKEMLNFLDAVDKTGVKKLIVDALQAVYPLTEDIGQWIFDVITRGFIDRGVTRIAYLYPSDYLTKLGLESFLGDANLKIREIKRNVFDDVDKAVEWLKKD